MQYRYYSFEVEISAGTRRKKTVWRPIVEVILLHGKRIVSYPVLIDSGADYNIFHSVVAEALGINLTSRRKRKLYGLGGQPIKGYEHKINIKMVGLRTVESKAIFTKELPGHAFGVLGNEGFFDHFEVRFDYNRIQENRRLKPTDELNPDMSSSFRGNVAH